nr:hypothetical protein GCM10020063_047100 [Dactylosporangium thailandense]
MAAEFHHDGYIFVLDGRVMDVFHQGTPDAMRFHVAFMGVDVKPKGDGYKVRVGAVVRGQVYGGVSLTMDAATFERFRAFVALATAARDAAANPGPA